MIDFSFGEISRLLQGRWLQPPRNMTARITAITDDSRQVEALVQSGKKVLFCAIDGREYGLPQDGHLYLKKAAESGACCLLTQRESSELLNDSGEYGILLVPNGLYAFQQLAGEHCQRMMAGGARLIGVTGSCGKTSSKEMCAAVLAHHFGDENVLKTFGNTNNDFGVPRNLFRITTQTKFAVIEAGTNHPGEIQRLADMIHPQISLICNIGAAHLEAFHTLEGVAEEKGDIFDATASDGICILPKGCAGEEILRRHAGNRRIITFGLMSDADIEAKYLGEILDHSGMYKVLLINHQTQEQAELIWQIGGAAQASNAAGAVAVGVSCGLSLNECIKGLQQCQLPGSRMQEMSDDAGVHWVNDAYNANPTSMLATMTWFDERSRQGKAQRRIFILGEMRELGEKSSLFHEKILNEALIRMLPHDTLYLVGQEFCALLPSHQKEAEEIRSFRDVSALKDYLHQSNPFKTGDWLFLKGSNGVRLFELYPAK